MCTSCRKVEQQNYYQITSPIVCLCSFIVAWCRSGRICAHNKTMLMAVVHLHYDDGGRNMYLSMLLRFVINMNFIAAGFPTLATSNNLT